MNHFSEGFLCFRADDVTKIPVIIIAVMTTIFRQINIPVAAKIPAIVHSVFGSSLVIVLLPVVIFSPETIAVIGFV